MSLPDLYSFPPVGLYPPSVVLPWEDVPRQDVQETDDELAAYWNAEEAAYRAAVETYFAGVASHLPGYDHAPYEVTVLRLGTHGLIVGHTPSDAQHVTVKPLLDVLDRPGESWNLFDIVDRMDVMRAWFTLAGGCFTLDAAEESGTRRAFADALNLLWHVQGPEWFETLARSVLEAEGVRLIDDAVEGADLVGDVVVREPMGYRRVERWGYRVIGPGADPLTEEGVSEISEWADDHSEEVVGCCIVSSGDHSTMGSALPVRAPRLRLLDRPLLVQTVHAHPHLLDDHFAAYGAALAQARGDSPPLAPAVAARLRHCPRGRGSFAQFESLGTECLSAIFGDALGAARKQKTTEDGVRRPDAVFPIRGDHPLWGRLRSRFGSDFLVVDFKNHSAPIGGDVLEDASKYGTDAVGKFVLVVSRAGGGASVLKRAIRVLNERGVCVLVIGDEHLVEMASLRDREERPEAVLSELLDDFLTSV